MAVDMTARYPVPGMSVGTGVMEFLTDNPSDTLKIVGYAADATQLATRIAQTAIGSNDEGVAVFADGAEAFGQVFFTGAKYIKGLFGFPMLVADAGINFAKGDARSIIKGAQRTADALYCGEATVKLIAAPFGGLSAQAAAVGSWMGAAGGLAGVALAMVGNFMTLASPFSRDVPEAIKGEEGGEVSREEMNLSKESIFSRVEVEIYDIEKAEHSSKQTSAWFGIAKNICHLALAIMGVIGLIIGSFMTATVGSVVVMTLSVAAIAFNMFAHIYKHHASDCKDEVARAKEFLDGYKAGGVPHDEGDVPSRVVTSSTSTGQSAATTPPVPPTVTTGQSSGSGQAEVSGSGADSTTTVAPSEEELRRLAGLAVSAALSGGGSAAAPASAAAAPEPASAPA